MSTRRAVVGWTDGAAVRRSLTRRTARGRSNGRRRWRSRARPNLHQVEQNFFRSAQPDATGFKGLGTTHGVRTVISLRSFNADEPLAAGLDLKLERVRINTWNTQA